MYSNEHNVFIASVTTSFARYNHHQTSAVQNLKAWLHLVHKISSCMGFDLHQCQYLLAALNFLSVI
jgi:hypothetical protein